jgi:hypothetical protein
MLAKLPFKKEHLFILSIIVALLLGYRLAFKNTVDAWQTNQQLTAQLAQSADLSYQPDYLQRKNSNLNKVIDLYKTDTVNFRSNCINKVSIIAEKENVKLNEIPVSDPAFNTEKWIVQKITLKGDYFALTKTINHIQGTAGIGVVRSINYRVPRNQSDAEKTKEMMADVFLEIAK